MRHYRLNKPKYSLAFKLLFGILGIILTSTHVSIAGPDDPQETPPQEPRAAHSLQKPDEDPEIQKLVKQVEVRAAQVNYPSSKPRKKIILIMTDRQLGHNLVLMSPIIASAIKSFPDYEIHYFGANSKVMVHNPVPGVYIHPIQEALSFLENRKPDDLVRFFIRKGWDDNAFENEALKELAIKWHALKASNVKVYNHAPQDIMDSETFAPELEPLNWTPKALGLKVNGNSFDFIARFLPDFTELPRDAEIQTLFAIPEDMRVHLEKIRVKLFSKGLAHPEWNFELINLYGESQQEHLVQNTSFSTLFEDIVTKRLSEQDDLNLVFAPFQGRGYSIMDSVVSDLMEKFPGRILDLSDIRFPFIYEHILSRASRFISVDTGMVHYALKNFPEKTVVLVPGMEEKNQLLAGWAIEGGKYLPIEPTRFFSIEDIYIALYDDKPLNYFLRILKEGIDEDRVPLAFEVLTQAKSPEAVQALLRLKASQNEEVRAYFVAHVSELALSTPEAFQVLVDILQKDEALDVRAMAFIALIELNLPESIPVLMDALKRQVNEFDDITLEALLELNLDKSDTAKLVTPLLSLLLGEDLVESRDIDETAILKGIQNFSTAEHIEEIASTIPKLNNPKQQIALYRTLATLGQKDTALKLILLSYRYPDACDSVYTALGEIGKMSSSEISVILPYLIQGLWEEEILYMRAASEALANLGAQAEPAVSALIEVLNDNKRTELARLAATHALEKLGPIAVSAVSTLIQVLSKEIGASELLRGSTVTALRKMGKEAASAVQPLITVLNEADASPFLRSSAAEALGELGHYLEPKAVFFLVAELRHALKDDDFHIRQSAAVALGSLGALASSAAIDLVRIMQEDEHFSTTQAAARALSQLKPHLESNQLKDMFSILIQMLRGQNRPVVERAIETLGELGELAAPAVSSLTEILKNNSEDIETRRYAARALGKLGWVAKSALPELHEVEHHTRSPKLKETTYKAIRSIQIAALIRAEVVELKFPSQMERERGGIIAESGGARAIEQFLEKHPTPQKLKVVAPPLPAVRKPLIPPTLSHLSSSVLMVYVAEVLSSSVIAGLKGVGQVVESELSPEQALNIFAQNVSYSAEELLTLQKHLEFIAFALSMAGSEQVAQKRLDKFFTEHIIPVLEAQVASGKITAEQLSSRLSQIAFLKKFIANGYMGMMAGMFASDVVHRIMEDWKNGLSSDEIFTDLLYSQLTLGHLEKLFWGATYFAGAKGIVHTSKWASRCIQAKRIKTAITATTTPVKIACSTTPTTWPAAVLTLAAEFTLAYLIEGGVNYFSEQELRASIDEARKTGILLTEAVKGKDEEKVSAFLKELFAIHDTYSKQAVLKEYREKEEAESAIYNTQLTKLSLPLETHEERMQLLQEYFVLPFQDKRLFKIAAHADPHHTNVKGSPILEYDYPYEKFRKHLSQLKSETIDFIQTWIENKERIWNEMGIPERRNWSVQHFMAQWEALSHLVDYAKERYIRVPKGTEREVRYWVEQREQVLTLARASLENPEILPGFPEEDMKPFLQGIREANPREPNVLKDLEYLELCRMLRKRLYPATLKKNLLGDYSYDSELEFEGGWRDHFLWWEMANEFEGKIAVFENEKAKLTRHRDKQLMPIFVKSFGLESQDKELANNKFTAHGFQFYPATAYETDRYFMMLIAEAMTENALTQDHNLSKTLSDAFLALQGIASNREAARVNILRAM